MKRLGDLPRADGRVHPERGDRVALTGRLVYTSRVMPGSSAERRGPVFLAGASPANRSQGIRVMRPQP